MAWVRGPGAKSAGGYPTGLRGALSVTCPVSPCHARIGRRCSTYIYDDQGRPVWVRYQAKPHPARIEAARTKGQAP